jgi:hypothetical protein
MPARPTQRKPTRRRSRRPPWEDWPDHRLLDLRLSDLGLEIERSRLASSIRQVYRELARRGIRFRPHFWLAEEWFSPDGIPGVAVPFYLAHPRLMQLERRQMLEVEGGTQEGCMRLLRHEVGHALDHAYLLHRRRKWQRLFGKSSQPYPTFYMPRPYSKQYVLHLDFWYAQSHPDEDFAETFAVWLRPRALWRKRYQGWPALRKLEFVDELMGEIAGKKPLVRTKATFEPLSHNRRTLREYYQEKKDRLAEEYPEFYDYHLTRLFSDDPSHAKNEAASAFIRRNSRYIRSAIAQWTGEYEYMIDLVMKELSQRSRELKLKVAGREEQTIMDLAVMITVHMMNYLHSGRHRMGM